MTMTMIIATVFEQDDDCDGYDNNKDDHERHDHDDNDDEIHQVHRKHDRTPQHLYISLIRAVSVPCLCGKTPSPLWHPNILTRADLGSLGSVG